MEIILLQEVDKLGSPGQVVRVAKGSIAGHREGFYVLIRLRAEGDTGDLAQLVSSAYLPQVW